MKRGESMKVEGTTEVSYVSRINEMRRKQVGSSGGG